MIGLTVVIIGGIIMLLGIIFINKNPTLYWTLLVIGLGIAISTSECRYECFNEGTVFSHQKVNCEGELTCYCKEQITPPKPKVVIIT